MLPRTGSSLINPFEVLGRAGVGPGMHVADLGCGAFGHFVFPAAELVGATGKVYAVDIQKTVLEAVEHQARQRRHWQVVCVWSDIDKVGAARIPSASLDVTLVINNFFLSADRPSLVLEALRLTKPGGRLLIIEWNKESGLIGPEMSKRMSPEETQAYFHHQDLRFDTKFSAGSDHYALLYHRLQPDPMAEVLSVSHPIDHSSQEKKDMAG